MTKKEILYEKAIIAIQKHKLFFYADLSASLGISHLTFYNYFPAGSKEHTEFGELMEQNKINVKVGIRSKLAASNRAAELIALYKIIATNDERKALSMQYVDVTSDNKPLQTIDLSKLSDGALAELLAAAANQDGDGLASES
jgi:hypothetical protein